MRFLSLFLIAFITACGGASSESAEVPGPPPNIVYILADDLGYGDLSVYNPASKIATPHLDRLAGEGMRFTDAHSPSAVCTPTRYGILTGRYCWRSRLPVGVLWGYGRSLIEPERMTVASFLQQHSYATGVVGKWHLGLDWPVKEGKETQLAAEAATVNDVGLVTDMNPEAIDFSRHPANGPLALGFDYSFILPASLDIPPYCFLENDSLVAAPTEHTPGNDLNTGFTGAFWRAGAIAPGFEFEQVLPTFIEKANAFIRRQAAKDRPFFLYLPLAAPHTPWVPTAPFQGDSGAGAYGDFVSMVDAAIGQVLQVLEEQELTDETLLIFTSDNGPFWTPELIGQYGHRAAASWRGMKADIWEGGHRIPFIVRWPGKVTAGTQSDALTSLTSLPATCAELLNAELPAGAAEDSRSILPVLLSRADTVPGQQAVVLHSSRGVFAVRQGDWKLILGRGSGGFSKPATIEPKGGEATGQLYHLGDDPGETQNRYLEEPEQVARMTALLEEIRGVGR